jgi:hypothetical protein
VNWGALGSLIGLRERYVDAPPIATARPVVRVEPDSAPPRLGQASAASESILNRRRPRGLQHHSPREHALLLIRWLQRNVDLTAGYIFHDEILEHYTEAVIEAGWAERSWNPVGRQVALICSAGKKKYQYAIVKGQKKRRRFYPIPAVLSEVAPAPVRKAAA